ncbi:MAG TPA: SMC family ATPase [Ktedonobacteraceae bacterium]|nr:SMC family ATPase [Ktedonobacteraceae bacterium]
MLITRIDLENVKSYRTISVEMGRGTTAISGVNGAGKTTIVEAIGFALFDYLPYNREQFIREGEKYGKIVVHLVGSDDRPYEVERRFGSSAHWFVYDKEADLHFEQGQDVMDKLHDLFGIDRDRPLKSLFRDALGVPQGTFTAVFLQAGAERKKTFDALLQIEDYKTSATNLLKTSHYYKEQMSGREREIDHLAYETRDLAAWHTQLQEARTLDEQQKLQNVQQTQQLRDNERRKNDLKAQADRVRDLKIRYDESRNAREHAQNLLHERERQFTVAREAWQVVQASSNGYYQYEQTEQSLRELRKQSQQRDTLRAQQASLQQSLGQIEERIKNWQQRLADVAQARQRIVALVPLVEQQVELEKQRDVAVQRLERLQLVSKQGHDLKKQQMGHQSKQDELQRQISATEPLKPLAECLQERTDAYSRLQARLEGKQLKEQQLKTSRTRQHDLQVEYERSTAQLDQLQQRIAHSEAQRTEAEKLPAVQEQEKIYVARQHRLLGSIEAYKDSRAQSVGGQCPFLHESCLNIKQRGVVSLESYFDNLIDQEQEQSAQVRQQLATIVQQRKQLQQYADDVSKLDQYYARRDEQEHTLQRHQQELQRGQQEIDDLVRDLETLQSVEQQMSEAASALQQSRQAEAKVRLLDGLQRQHQQLQEQIQELEERLQELRNERESLLGCKEEKETVETRLRELDDPRGQTREPIHTVEQEDMFTQQLQGEVQSQQTLASQLQGVQEQLSVYATLDTAIAQHEYTLQHCLEPHRRYLENQKEARALSEREQAYQEQVAVTQQATETLEQAEQAYNVARADFVETDLPTVEQELERLSSSLASLASNMQHNQDHIMDLLANIDKAQAFLVELDAAQQELQTLKDLLAMLESFRKLLTEAGPYILKAMLDNISAEANRIFGEIMGDRSAQLSWQNDYEIMLRRQGVNRSFAQLSGGEQMSAALAVRLALLKKLSTLNIAFFDEPTQNMDELRRMNLAEQIRRVRGFDQLIVISHDDTFEQGLDCLVRLQKDNGETRLLSEDEVMSARREPLSILAS